MTDERVQIEFPGSGNQGSQVGYNAPGGIIKTYYNYPTGKSASVSTLKAPLILIACLERSETPPSPSLSIPFGPDADFVERGELLGQVQQKCAIPGSRTAMVGFGGVGYV